MDVEVRTRVPLRSAYLIMFKRVNYWCWKHLFLFSPVRSRAESLCPETKRQRYIFENWKWRVSYEMKVSLRRSHPTVMAVCFKEVVVAVRVAEKLFNYGASLQRKEQTLSTCIKRRLGNTFTIWGSLPIILGSKAKTFRTFQESAECTKKTRQLVHVLGHSTLENTGVVWKWVS